MIDEMELKMFNCLNVEIMFKKSCATADGHLFTVTVKVKLQVVSSVSISTVAGERHLFFIV